MALSRRAFVSDDRPSHAIQKRICENMHDVDALSACIERGIIMHDCNALIIINTKNDLDILLWLNLDILDL